MLVPTPGIRYSWGVQDSQPLHLCCPPSLTQSSLISQKMTLVLCLLVSLCLTTQMALVPR